MSEKKDKAMNFADLFKDAKPIKHGQYVDTKKSKALSQSQSRQSRLAQAKQRVNEFEVKQQKATIELSDEYEAHFPPEKPVQYLRAFTDEAQSATSKDVLKKLKMGLYPPDIEVDFHGLTVKQAKEELIGVIFEANKRHLACVNIIHGHGNGILKQKIPNWLVQHPSVIGFIQSPKAYGGKAGLMLLLTLNLK